VTRLAVWAPKPERVAVQLGQEQRPLTRDVQGWWSLEVPDLQPGGDYAFVLDGGDPRPDPRSRFQPHGVHGPSRVFDTAAFVWDDGGWQPPPLETGLVYELHVGTFTPAGTFAAAIQRLDHLVALGVTHVELMPVVEFPGQHGWGYDGVSLWAPHHAYGGPFGLQQWVNACHRRGLAVLLDVVYNHLGPDGNYLSQYGPYFTSRYATPWGDAVNFDGPDSDEVRRYFLENAAFWFREYHVDGLRLDAVHAILDTSAVHFLEELAGETAALSAQLGRRLVLIGESDLNDPRLIRSSAQGGYGLDAQWSDDYHHALHSVLTGEQDGYYQDFGRLADVAAALQGGYVYAGSYSPHRRRRHGRPLGHVPPQRLLGYLQTHDQVGNRARGERLSQLIPPALLKVGAALVLTAPFVPMVLQGEEWGAGTPFLYFTDHQDERLAEAVSAGRRTEFASFGWDPAGIPDPQAAETFQQSRLDWNELEHSPHFELLDWHRQLVRLRRAWPDLYAGGFPGIAVAFDEAARWLAFRRGALQVVCNLGQAAQLVPLLPGAGCARVLLASAPSGPMGSDRLQLPGQSVAILGPD
jgi:maltooligosyltrehalose trehalohydrolase